MNVKVLLVDDEAEFVDVLAERLETRGFTVLKALNGDEGLAKLQEEKVDVAVLDMLMPGKDGIETLLEIKQTHPLVEVIILTGRGTIETAIEGLKRGAYDYLRKPAETEELVAKILRAYARKSEQQERIRTAENDKVVGSPG
jgi:DNA-binding NtrC family response regulator